MARRRQKRCFFFNRSASILKRQLPLLLLLMLLLSQLERWRLTKKQRLLTLIREGLLLHAGPVDLEGGDDLPPGLRHVEQPLLVRPARVRPLPRLLLHLWPCSWCLLVMLLLQLVMV